MRLGPPYFVVRAEGADVLAHRFEPLRTDEDNPDLSDRMLDAGLCAQQRPDDDRDGWCPCGRWYYIWRDE